MSAGYAIRQATKVDLPGMYRVCLQTGNAGKDATLTFPTYSNALGERWVGGAHPHLCTYKPCLASASIFPSTGPPMRPRVIPLLASFKTGPLMRPPLASFLEHGLLRA